MLFLLLTSFCLLTEVKLVLTPDCSLPSELKNPDWGNDTIFVWVSVNLAGFNIQCYMSNIFVNFGTENISSCPINCNMHN